MCIRDRFYLYFSSNAATTMEEGRFCFYLSGRQEVDAGKELFDLVRFYMLECGVYLALIWHDHKKDALFYLTAASLMVYPLFRMGAAGTGDFTMRASIPVSYTHLNACAQTGATNIIFTAC